MAHRPHSQQLAGKQQNTRRHHFFFFFLLFTGFEPHERIKAVFFGRGSIHPHLDLSFQKKLLS